MTIPTCEHIKPGGTRCGSPAIHDDTFCYYHRNLRRALPKKSSLYFEYNPKATTVTDQYTMFELPVLEDAASVQIAFMQLIHGVASQCLEPKQARLILSALHGAARNLRLLQEAMPSCPEERETKKKPAAGVKNAKSKKRA